MIFRAERKPPRPKKCPICTTSYVRVRAVQPTCRTFRCESAYAERKARKRIAREKYLAGLDTRYKAGLMAPYSEILGAAQAAFNSFIRLRDFFLPCVSCGATDPPRKAFGGAWDAGHYRTTGACPELRFEPLNCAKQCKACNGNDHRSSKQESVRAEFRKTLVVRNGLPAVEWIEGPHAPKRYRAEDLIAEKRKWQRASVEMRKARKAEQARAAA